MEQENSGSETIVALTESQIKTLRGYAADRDAAALRLGVMRHQYLQAETRLCNEIARSLQTVNN